MDSRLPKPRALVKPTVTTKDEKMQQEPAPGSSSSTATTSVKQKANIENKPPPKAPLLRSKTTMAITRRPAIAPAREAAPKRPAPTARPAVEIKRPRLAPSKPAPPKSAPVSNTAKAVKSETGPVKPKPNKWDLKGRLAYATDELNDVKTQKKEIAAQLEEVTSTLQNLRDNEKDYKFKADKLEAESIELKQKLESDIGKITLLEAQHAEVAEQNQKLQQDFEQVSANYQECQQKCDAAQITISTLQQKLDVVERSLESKTKEMEEIVALRNEFETMVQDMDRERRVLHNTIQDLKGNIRVFCRVRPQTEKELEKKTCTINFLDEGALEIAPAENTSMSCGKVRTTKQEFSFDKVFPPTASQETIFQELSMLVQSALEGYNVCVFAYGQTGSGKTYTMEGGLDEAEGMIPRTVRHIFKEMKHFELLGWEYTIEASILEIYNEHIVDLLDSETKTHEIRMVDQKGTDLYVSNLKIQEIKSPEMLHECLVTAQRNRACAATMANERSSRSHSVTRIRLIGTHRTKNEMCVGNLNLVDLAGSERLKNEEAARTTETKNINKSLSNLGNVILALLKKQDHVPYRNSKLTHILMPSLGGNSKTLMLLNVSPLEECYYETLNSLRFASTVNSCKMGAAKKVKTVANSQ